MGPLCKRRAPNKAGAYFLVGRRAPPGERILTFALQGPAQFNLHAAGDSVPWAVLRFVVVE